MFLRQCGNGKYIMLLENSYLNYSSSYQQLNNEWFIKKYVILAVSRVRR